MTKYRTVREMNLAVGVMVVIYGGGRACPLWEAPFPGWDSGERELGCSTHLSFSASGLWGHVTSSLRPLLLHFPTRN